MTRMRITNIQIEGYIAFMDELNYVLDAIRYVNPFRIQELDNIYLWLRHIEVDVSLHQMKLPNLRWSSLSAYAHIEQYHLLGTLRSTKFVQYADFSIRNFILSNIQHPDYPVKSTKIHLPDHVDLKQFWLPEDLIIKQRQDVIYEADWLK